MWVIGKQSTWGRESPSSPNTFQIGRKESQGDKGWPFLSYCRENDVKCSRAERISPAMYRVHYLEQTDKMSQQVRLSMVEVVYPPALLSRCVQQSPKRQQKQRRLRHFTALSVLWFLLAMALCRRLSQRRVWDKMAHWPQQR